MASKDPEITRETKQIIAVRASRFEKDLSHIALSCARHENCEYILERHTNEAFETLGRLGLNRRAWWARPDLETGLGGAIVGLASSLPDNVNEFLPTAIEFHSRWVPLLMATGYVLGTLLFSHGFWRGTQGS